MKKLENLDLLLIQDGDNKKYAHDIYLITDSVKNPEIYLSRTTEFKVTDHDLTYFKAKSKKGLVYVTDEAYEEFYAAETKVAA
tara:strand:- start:5348 stop:5596 length:249 start_codon:yes stop_codon:yes gene_type:complete